MKGEDMLKALTDIDEDLVCQATEKPTKGNLFKIMTAMAACLALAILAIWGVWRGRGPATSEPVKPVASYLTIDVNPSIRFTVVEGKIADYVAVNDDAKPILNDLELKGKTVQEAVPFVIAALLEQGYLAQEEQAPVLLVAAYGGEQPEVLLETATQVAKESLESKQIDTYIVSQQVIDVETVTKLAKEYGVSEGKMQYVLNLLAEENEVSLEGATSSTVVELFGMDIARQLIEPRYKVGEYDEHGTLVQYAGWPEHMNGYIPWEELPESYKQELEGLFSPADLEILSRPREWTTVPNAVGLPEAEARALMNSCNVAVRVHYMDEPEDLLGMECAYGVCYRQDVEPGMRWNTDANVSLYVYVGE